MSTLDYADRNAEILERRKGGESLATIAEAYSITPERVRQILFREVTGKPINRKHYIPSPKRQRPSLAGLPPYEHPFKAAEAG